MKLLLDLLLAATGLGLLGGRVGTQDPALLPPPLGHYFGREIAPTMTHEGASWLTRSSREREENTARMLEALHIKPGQTVCDFGCGNGYHTLRLLPMVGEKGSVHAVEIQQEMLDLLEKRRAEMKIEGSLVPVLGTVADPKLPESTFDLVLMVDVYHELSHPEHVLASVRRCLKTKGRIVLVEFRKEDPKVPIKELHKMSKEQILKEVPANGFRLVEQFDELPWQHMMFFERDPAAKVPEPGSRERSVYAPVAVVPAPVRD